MDSESEALPLEKPEVMPPAAGLRTQVLRGGTFLMIRQMVSMALSLIGVLIATHVLGPAKFGVYAAALGIYQYLQQIGQAGIGVYLVRTQQAPSKSEYDVATTMLLAGSLILILIIEACMGELGRWVGVAGFQLMLTALLIALPFQSVAITASSQLDRMLDFRSIAFIETGGQILYYLVALPLVLLTPIGAWSLVIGWVVQQVVMCIAFHIAAKYLPRLNFNLAQTRMILNYTMGFTASSWIYQLRSLVNPLIVGHFLGPSAVGIIGLGIRLLEMLAVAKNIAWRLAVAALARVQNDPKKLISAMTQGMHLQMLAIAPLLLGFSWFGGLILPHVFGTRWLPVMVVFPFLALSYMTNAQFNVHSSVLYVLRRNGDVALFNATHVILFGLVSFITVPRVGLIGYGWGEVAGLGAYAVLHWRIARAVGPPGYRISFLWWLATCVGLFWTYLGLWAIAVPFLALLWPESLKLLKLYFGLVFGRVLKVAK